MIFKDFSFELPTIIGGEPTNDMYNLVKWQTGNDGKRSYFVIATIRYNHKEPRWEFESCGLKYLQYYEDGLNEFVLKWCELLDLQKKYHNEEMEEFYAHY